jgi:tRNA dimethylallyltransferase
MGIKSEKLILIIGPTASGKSEYAQRLALRCNGEIINYDSQQFYRGLNIGTGKLSPQERRVPHWLLDTLEPGSFMTAGEFTRQAEVILEEIFSRGKTPIFVGGTGLYVRSLLEGIDDLPPRDPEIRQRLERELSERGPQALHQRLIQIDPNQASRVSPADRLRIVRFLEIYEISGSPPSQLLQKGRAVRLRYPTQTHWLFPTRDILREKIAQRVGQMFVRGWPEEVQGFLNRGEDPREWENKPIGYAELAQVLIEKNEPASLIPMIIQKTRAYAKRQETFFRGLLGNPAYKNFGSSLKVLENFGENL